MVFDKYFLFQNGDILHENDTLLSNGYCLHGSFDEQNNKVDLDLLICIYEPEPNLRFPIFATCKLIRPVKYQ